MTEGKFCLVRFKYSWWKMQFWHHSCLFVCGRIQLIFSPTLTMTFFNFFFFYINNYDAVSYERTKKKKRSVPTKVLLHGDFMLYYTNSLCLWKIMTGTMMMMMMMKNKMCAKWKRTNKTYNNNICSSLNYK